MATELVNRGYQIISGGTDNHSMLIDMRSKNISGKDAEAVLGHAHITVNKNMVPFDDKSPFVTSGIRVGTPAITSRGVKETEIVKIVDLIDSAINNRDNAGKLADIKEEVSGMMSKYPLFAQEALV